MGGSHPGWPEQRIRIEAAAYRGKPVYFQIIWPWTTPTRMTTVPASTKGAWLQTLATVLFMAVLVGALLVARHNLRERRGDRRGARLIATTVLLGTLGAFEIGGSHVPVLNTEIGRLFTGLGDALWAASTLWVLYIALEPYVRRFWPTTLIAWSRMTAGQLRDPLVGRDILIGCLFAAGIQALGDAWVVLVSPALGYTPQPSVPVAPCRIERHSATRRRVRRDPLQRPVQRAVVDLRPGRPEADFPPRLGDVRASPLSSSSS